MKTFRKEFFYVDIYHFRLRYGIEGKDSTNSLPTVGIVAKITILVQVQVCLE